MYDVSDIGANIVERWHSMQLERSGDVLGEGRAESAAIAGTVAAPCDEDAQTSAKRWDAPLLCGWQVGFAGIRDHFPKTP